MTEKRNNDLNVPTLRFPGFDDEWNSSTIGDLLDFKVTNSLSREKLNYNDGKVKNIHYGDIHTKFQTLFNIQNEEVPFINDEVSLSKIQEDYYCKKGDLVFADASEDLNDIGKSIEIINTENQKLLAGLHTLLGRPKPNVFYPGFAGYLFLSNTVRTQIQREAQGAKVLGISVGRISKVELNYPSLEEQKKISSLLSIIDTRIQTQNKIIEQLESLIKSIREKLFSQKLRFKNEKRNEFSEWKMHKLGDVCQIIMGQSPGSNSYNTEGNGLPLIQGNADIENRKTKPRNYTVEITKECEIGDLILTVRAPVGTIAKSIHKACIGRGVCALKTNEENESEYIYQFLINYEPKWVSLEQGSTFTAVGGSEIKSININLPCLSEQKAIAKTIFSIDDKIENELEVLKILRKQKEYLLKQIFI